MWCSNPEGRSSSVELAYGCDRCIGTDECDRCVAICLEEAITQGEDGKVTIDRSGCDVCGDCAYVCPSNALEVSGDWVEVDEVLRIVEEDDAFYARSGGGLTLSGGEPLAQGKFACALLEAAKARGIDTAVETSGLCNWNTLKRAASLTNRLFFDIKCRDSDKHERVAGVPNEKILDNFQRLRAELPDLDVVVRTPVIPGINDTKTEIEAIAEFVNEVGGASAYELLPYHGFGEPKYTKLGKHYRLSHLRPPHSARMTELREVAVLHGL
jgi:pyruvate formate lyase activating enzyme